jgi:hypothetical protein
VFGTVRNRHNSKSKHNRGKRDTSSVQTRVVYVEHCDPININIDLLRANHPEPAHPDRSPVRLNSILWSLAQTLEEYWSSDSGAEFLDKWFSIPKI